MLEKILQNFFTLFENSTSFFALIGILILILFFLYSKKIKFTTKMLINVSLMLALAFVLSYLRIYHLPQGGSVTLGSMIPLLIISFRYGGGVGIFAGFIFGLITILQDPFILHPVQVLFDYPLPFMAIGIAGFFPQKIFLGTVIAFAGKFLCHFISGIVFFASYAPEGMSPIIYSLATNASYIIPELLICLAILKFLPIQRILNSMDRK